MGLGRGCKTTNPEGSFSPQSFFEKSAAILPSTVSGTMKLKLGTQDTIVYLTYNGTGEKISIGRMGFKAFTSNHQKESASNSTYGSFRGHVPGSYVSTKNGDVFTLKTKPEKLVTSEPFLTTKTKLLRKFEAAKSFPLTPMRTSRPVSTTSMLDDEMKIKFLSVYKKTLWPGECKFRPQKKMFGSNQMCGASSYDSNRPAR